MLWLLIARCLVNVLLAVRRPKMMIKVSQSVYKATSMTARSHDLLLGSYGEPASI